MSPKGINRRAGQSEHLEDVIDRPVREPVAHTDRNDAVDPIVSWGTGLKQRIHPEIVAPGIDRLTLVQSLENAGRTCAQALIRHNDQSAICRSQRLPVVAADHFTG